MTDPAAVTALVLAAGAGSRFGGGKMQAALGGRILPAHVVATAQSAGIERFVVVLGRDAAAVGAGLAGAGPFLTVINPEPERGLASSLRSGMAAATAGLPTGVLILLGDQPAVRSAVIEALLAAVPPAGTIAIAPRYADDPALNPVLVLPDGFPLVSRAVGDRGLGWILADFGDAVVRVPVAGANPDIDTPADLASLESRP